MTPSYKPANTGMRDDIVSLKIETVYDAVGKIVDKHYLTAKKVKDIYVSDFENIKTIAGKIMALNVSDEDILKACQIELQKKKLADTSTSVSNLTTTEQEAVEKDLYSKAIEEASSFINQIANLAKKSYDEEKKSTNSVVTNLATSASTNMKSIETNAKLTKADSSDTKADSSDTKADSSDTLEQIKAKFKSAKTTAGTIVGLAENAISSLNAIIEAETSPVIVNDLWSTKDAKLEMLNKKNIYLEDYNTSLKAENKEVRKLYNETNTKLIQKTADYEVEKDKANNNSQLVSTLNTGFTNSLNSLNTLLDTTLAATLRSINDTLSKSSTSLGNASSALASTKNALADLMPTYQINHLNPGDNNIFSQYQRELVSGKVVNV